MPPEGQRAVATRYPGEFEAVTENDYLDAMRLAEAVTQWATGIVQDGGSRPDGI